MGKKHTWSSYWYRKEFDKIQHHFFGKKKNKQECDKGHLWKTHSSHYTNAEKSKAFPKNQKQGKDVHSHHLYSTMGSS